MPAAEKPPEPKTMLQAILAVQGELPKVGKDSINPHFKSKYVSLDSLMDAMLPVLNKNGLLWLTQPQEEHLHYRLIHAESGDEIADTMPLLAAKDDPQGQGAAITYARRYALTAVLGITADEDDDGNRAATARRESRVRQERMRHGSITEEQALAMRQQIGEAGLDFRDVYQKVGITTETETTPEQARVVKKIIDEAGGQGTLTS